MPPEESPNPSTDEQPDVETQRSGRFAALKHLAASTRRRKMISAVLGLVAIAVTVGAIVAASRGSGSADDISIEACLAALDSEEFLQSQIMAMQLRGDHPEDPQIRAVAAFVAGVVAVHETDHRWEKDKTTSYVLAARQLEEASQFGFPDGREGQGLFLLGRCLYEGGQFTECLAPLTEALAALPDRSAAIHSLLAKAQLLAAVPDPAKSLEHNSAYLDATTLSADERNRALLERAEILLRLSKTAKAEVALDTIPENSPQRADALVIRGRLLVGVEPLGSDRTEPADTISLKPISKERKQQLDDAIRLFREALAISKPNSDSTRKATYLIGAALAEKQDWLAALEQFERTRRIFYDSPEGHTATLYAGDVLRSQGHHDEAIAMYRRAFSSAGSPRTYGNPWLSLDDFRKRMIAAYRYYLNENEFERALSLLEGFQPLFTVLQTIELQAKAQRAWAESLLQQDRGTITERRELRRQGYEHFRLAGYTFARLARLRKATEAYPDDLWESAVALAQGQDHFHAIRMFQAYIDAQPGQRQAEALVWLGQSQLVAGRLDDAISSFLECLEFHKRDAAIFDARLWCARAHLEKGENEQAEELLNSNLVGEGLTPASREWRQSLFLLGQVLHESGRYEEAIVKLEESVARGPETPDALLGMYLIARSYREAAKEPQEKLDQTTIESVRLANAKKLRQMLEGSLQYYGKLQKQLLQKEERGELAEMELAMLRNCYFATGAVLFQLKRYDEAIEAFSDATTRFQNEPLVLEAFVQIANSHRRLGRDIEAKGALAQARVVLKRLDPELQFTETTNYTHEEWGRAIDRMAQW